MSDTFAILYTPGSNKEKEKWLLQKFRNVIKNFNVGTAKIKINPRLPIKNFWEGPSNNLITLIMGWGLDSRPNWGMLIPKPMLFESLRQFIAVDLFEREGLDGKFLKKPNSNAGKYWSLKMKQNNRNLFFDGYFLQANVPYGLKKVPVCDIITDDSSSSTFTFEPGDSSEVEIIRTIYDFFVTHDYNRSEICSLLNAQEVQPPKRSNIWNTRIITTILESPFYVGANQYRGFIKYDVFPPIVDKSIYFEAQAKLSQLNFITEIKTSNKLME